MQKLFSFDGRVRRLAVWLSAIVSVVAYLILFAVLSGGEGSGFSVLVFLVFWFMMAIIGLSITVRRWHDLNKSGWWVLINLVPIVGGLYSFVMLGFMSGDEGPNSYGLAPDEGAIL